MHPLPPLTLVLSVAMPSSQGRGEPPSSASLSRSRQASRNVEELAESVVVPRTDASPQIRIHVPLSVRTPKAGSRDLGHRIRPSTYGESYTPAYECLPETKMLTP